MKVLALGLQPVNGCKNSGQRLLFILISQITVTCKYNKKYISRQQAILKCLSQSGSAPEQSLRDVQAEISAAEEELCVHKEVATAAREYYTEMTQKCKDSWKEMSQLSVEQDPSPEVVSQLAVARHKFTLVLSADSNKVRLS